MSVRFYMDVHVPWSVTAALREKNVDVLTAIEDGTDEMADPDLLDRATKLGRVLVTQDGDFLVEGALRQRMGRQFSGIIYTHQQNVTIGRCIHDLELLAKASLLDEFENRVEHLPFR